MIFQNCDKCGRRERITLKRVYNKILSLESSLRYHEYENSIPHTHIQGDLIAIMRRLEELEKKKK